MSSLPDSPSVVAIPKYLLRNDLNSTLLYMLLMGIYMTVAAFTLYMYTQKKKDRSLFVTCILWISLAMNISSLGIQWKLINECFIDDTQPGLFNILCDIDADPGSLNIAITVITSLQFLLADGLMVWRCYHINGQSLRATSIPLFFLGCEIAMGIVDLSLGISLFQKSDTSKEQTIMNIIISAYYATTVLTTVSSTFLICQRIMKSMAGTQHTSRYKYILRIAIESSVIYSISSVLNTVSTILNIFPNLKFSTVAGINVYVSAVTSFMTEMAPTLMIAQISLSPTPESPRPTNRLHISSLHFIQHETAHSMTGYNVNDSPSDTHGSVEKNLP